MKPAILLLTIALVGYGQTSTTSPKYEEASIKANTDGGFRFAFQIDPGGTLAATGITLKRLMMTAYNVHGFRIVGGPDWVDSRRWNVQAKHDGAASPDQIHKMLRSLLENRFQLHTHSETREMPIYELSIGGNGSKVPRTENGAKHDVRARAGSIQITNEMSATFASQLSYALGTPVLDKTGLRGEFDFTLRWTPKPGEDGGPTGSGLPPGTPEEPAPTPDGPSIFTAIQEQLGLRLQSARASVEVIVIDRVESPSDN